MVAAAVKVMVVELATAATVVVVPTGAALVALVQLTVVAMVVAEPATNQLFRTSQTVLFLISQINNQVNVREHFLLRAFFDCILGGKW